MSPINEYTTAIELLDESYRHWTGEHLPGSALSANMRVI